jgi:ribosomal protein S18 acetylase RimI-like enzyme
MLTITPLTPSDIPLAAKQFAIRFSGSRRTLPLLPSSYEDPARATEGLAGMASAGRALAAWDGNRLAGYLGWYEIDNFRRASHRAAYVPEWGFYAQPGREAQVVRALYRSASELWSTQGCSEHAITLLAGDNASRDAWFWSGFGLLVIDAVRSLDPIGAPIVPGYAVRRAEQADIPLLVEIEAEHDLHYTRPPVFMAAPKPDDAGAFERFLAVADNSAWLASREDEVAGYLRVEGSGFGAADVVQGENGAAVTGEYVRPAHRGMGLAPALLDAALAYYRGLGKVRLTVDFESTNPEAAAFWPRYFTPACYSLLRIPEITRS